MTRVAVVTGASQGIGAGLVTAFRGLGYSVVATALTIGEPDDPGVATVAGDIAEPGLGAHLVATAVERFGRVDTLVNNAGVFVAKPFTEYTDEDYDLVAGVNLRGFFEVTRPVVAAMLDGGGGHVVNISTSLVDRAAPGGAYALASLTKGGLHAVAKALAVEYADRGIRFNTVALGVIRTSMHPEMAPAREPVARLGEISDVVGAVLYLENAPFVTGEIMHVDGGRGAGREMPP